MKRLLYNKLLEWKNNSHKKPLILTGTRQVGKTYLLKRFGKKEYNNTFHFDFDKEKETLTPIFEKSIDPNKIIKNLSVLRNQKIDLLKDLIIFDEIQQCPKALNSLKYFNEDYPGVSICAAGSLLGLSLSSESYPVGKVSYMNLYPLTFYEYLLNDGEQLLLEEYNNGLSDMSIAPVAHNKLIEKLLIYYIIGGMPEVVDNFLNQQENFQLALNTARTIQKSLVNDYSNDFAKHAGKLNATHIQSIFKNTPLQLASYGDYSVNRYKFKDVIAGKKGFGALNGPITWLEKAGLLIKVLIANRSEIPLISFCKENIFKLYLFDIGILGCMLGIEPKTLLLNNYGIIKGFFVENCVAQELLASIETNLISWKERNAEIEFIYSFDNKIIPIEVKSGKRTKSQSLKSYQDRYQTDYVIQITAKELQVSNSGLFNIPLYYSGFLPQLIQKLYDK
ncbi:MAG: ATP-binding protein [Spirochaetes bacterium]|nr:ATP-binding protein [Spirochaetota bacterium]